MSAQQIPLQFVRYEPFNLDQFIEPDDSNIKTTILELIDNTNNIPLYLWGKNTTGKSHLLQAACQYANHAGLKVAYVPLSIVIEHSPASLEGLEQQDLICIDDVQLVKGLADWQIGLFNLYNRVRDLSKKFIMSADQSPLNIAIELADLKSRLSWGNTVHLKQLNDEQKIELLQQKAKQRAFDLNDDVALYLLKQVNRDLNYLLSILDKIDEQSLIEQRKITIPFIKTLLK